MEDKRCKRTLFGKSSTDELDNDSFSVEGPTPNLVIQEPSGLSGWFLNALSYSTNSILTSTSGQAPSRLSTADRVEPRQESFELEQASFDVDQEAPINRQARQGSTLNWISSFFTYQVQDNDVPSVPTESNSSRWRERSILFGKTPDELLPHEIFASVGVRESGFRSMEILVELAEEWAGEYINEENVDEIMRRRVEALREYRAAGKKQPDCGFYRQHPHLSRARAIENSREFAVGIVDSFGSKIQLPLSVDLGCFTFPFFSRPPIKDVLEVCGPGIVLYFKLLKSLIILFICMSLLTLPNQIMFGLEGNQDPVERKFIENTRSQSLLAYTTIGSLGEPLPSCRQVPENSTFSFRCPSGGKISSIVSYYGQPYGSCGCPRKQYPKQKGVCNGTRSGISEKKVFSDRFNYKGQICLPDSAGNIYPCFLGATRYDMECCSSVLNAEGFADLTSLELQINPRCNSLTLPYIIEALCLNRSTCSLPILLDNPVYIPLANLRNESVKSIICRDLNSTTCITDLAYGGFFEDCSPNQQNEIIFEGICFTESISGLNSKFLNEISVNNRADLVYAASIFDAISIIIFLIGLSFIRARLNQESKLLDRNICRANDFTIECYTVPSGENKNDIISKVKQHFERVISMQTPILYDECLGIIDVNVGISTYQYIQAACRRGDRAREVDRVIGKIVSRMMRKRFSMKRTEDIQELNSLKEALYHYAIINQKCDAIQHTAISKIDRLYITFESEECVLRCLRAFNNHGTLEGCFQNPELFLEGKPVYIKRSIDPSEILWENLGVPLWSRILRIFATSILVLISLAISYTLIFEALTISEDPFERKYTIPCSTYEVSLNMNLEYSKTLNANTITYQSVLADYNWAAYNSSGLGSQGYLLCYCKQLNYELGLEAMKSFEFFDIYSNQNRNWCRNLAIGGGTSQLAIYVTTFVIILLNTCLLQILRKLAVFECHQSYSSQIISVVAKLSFAQYFNTGILSLIIYGDLTNVSGKDLYFGSAGSITFGVFTGSFKDFTAAWYTAVGSSLLFTMCMYIFADQLYLVACLIYKRLLQLWDQRMPIFPFISSSISHFDLQTELDHLYLLPEFPFEGHVASLLTIIFVSMSYSAAMPLMNGICCCSLFVLFILSKVFILRFHSVPTVYSASIPKIVARLIYIAVAIHCCIGIWCYGNNTFTNPDFHHKEYVESFRSSESTFRFLVSEHSWNEPINISDRVINKHSIFLLVIFAGLFLLFAQFFLRAAFKFLFGRIIEKIMTGSFFDSWIQYTYKGSHVPPFLESLPVVLLHNRVESGAISEELRVKYKNRLQKVLTNEVSLSNKLMEGLESYSLALSPEYSYRFGLDTFYMQRMPPTDWLISPEAKSEVLFLEATDPRRVSCFRSSICNDRKASVATRDSAVFGPESNLEINQILEYCSPIVKANSRVIKKRRKNSLLRPEFDNNSQTGEVMYTGANNVGAGGFSSLFRRFFYRNNIC